jgi:Domain of unknown function (DUF4234)
MTDAPTPPEATPPPPPPAAATTPTPPPTPPPPTAMPPAPAPSSYYMAPRGQAPNDIGGVFYSKGLTILLMIVTLGIWGIFWTYRTNEDLKKWNGDGLGGVLGIVIYLLLSVVLMFTIPNEIQKMYERDGRQSPVSTIWGLWFLLPIIGHIVWYLKVQGALNDFWASKGAAR